MTAAGQNLDLLRDVLSGLVEEDQNWWAPRMNRRFGLWIDVPPVVVEPLADGVDGMYRRKRGTFGTREVIIIDKEHALADESWQVGSTVAHELLHAHQHQHGVPPDDEGTTNHHNIQFRARALIVGLLVDHFGHTTLVPWNSPFSDLLRERGVAVPDSLMLGVVGSLSLQLRSR